MAIPGMGVETCFSPKVNIVFKGDSNLLDFT